VLFSSSVSDLLGCKKNNLRKIRLTGIRWRWGKSTLACAETTGKSTLVHRVGNKNRLAPIARLSVFLLIPGTLAAIISVIGRRLKPTASTRSPSVYQRLQAMCN